MKKVATFVLASLVAMMLFELFLRFSPFSYGISPVVYDKDVGMWHKKSFSSVWIKPCYHTRFFFDEKGLIKNDYNYDAKKEDILVFGDSYIEALMVQNPNVIHNALFREYHGKYNFLNYGLSDTSAVQQLIMMQTKADFSHAKTLVQFIRIESDIYDVDPANLEETARPKVFLDFKDYDHYQVVPPRKQDAKEKFRDVLGNFEWYVFIKKSLYYIKEKLHPPEHVSAKSKKDEDLSHNWLQLKGALYQTKRFLASKGVNYVVILYGKDARLNNELKSFLKEEHIVYHDILSLAKEEGMELEGFPCDSHWTDATHLRVAKIIKEKGLLP